MARKKSPKPLKQVCLKTVVKHINRLKDAQYLPGAIRNELYENREPHSYDRCLPPNVFISASTRKLVNINEFDANYGISQIIPKIIKTCHNLTHLSLTGLSLLIKPKQLQLLDESIPKIKILDLQKRNCSSDVLESIGKHCPRLQNLDISNSKFVDDAGIRKLCTKNTQLTKLDIYHTNVTVDGCAYVLNNIPSLTDIDYDKIIDMISAPQYSGKLLSRSIKNTNMTFTTNKQLRKSFEAFPNLSRLLIDTWSMRNGLRPVIGFEQLENLEINDFNGNSHTFDEKVKLTLWDLNKLTNLTIIGFMSVNLTVIGRSCPKLQCLYVDLNEETYERTLTEPCSHILFENLRMLTICYFSRATEIELLLRNCGRLEQLTVIGSKVFDDELFLRLLTLNPCKFLDYIYLRSCSGVSNDSLNQLLSMDNLLRRISLHGCENVDSVELNKFVREECLDVTVFFVTYL